MRHTIFFEELTNGSTIDVPEGQYYLATTLPYFRQSFSEISLSVGRSCRPVPREDTSGQRDHLSNIHRASQQGTRGFTLQDYAITVYVKRSRRSAGSFTRVRPGDFSRLLDKIISTLPTGFHNKVPFRRTGRHFANSLGLKEDSCLK